VINNHQQALLITQTVWEALTAHAYHRQCTKLYGYACVIVVDRPPFVTNKTGRVGVLFLTSDGRSSLYHSPGSVYNTRREWWERQLSVIIFTFPYLIIHLRSISFRDRPSVLTENRRFFYPPCRGLLMSIIYRGSFAVDLILLALRPPGLPCNVAGLVSCQRVWSVHVMSVPIAERLLTEWIALEHSVNLLQQWRHRTSLQNLLLKILSIWTFIVAM